MLFFFREFFCIIIVVFRVILEFFRWVLFEYNFYLSIIIYFYFIFRKKKYVIVKNFVDFIIKIFLVFCFKIRCMR